MNIVFCIESSFSRGMGHLYRSIKLAQAFMQYGGKNLQISFLLNMDQHSVQILQDNKLSYSTISNFDEKNWDRNFLFKKNVDVWINDRLNTSLDHVKLLKDNVRKVISFDDRGEGASLVDINFAPLIFNEPLRGNRVRSGVSYLIVDKDLKNFQRTRTLLKRVLISLGGSDNFFLTSKILKILDLNKYEVTVLLGPLNTQENEIKLLHPQLKVLRNAPCLGTLFIDHDLLISGGGMMPFEAISTGLPVLCCASETFEIPVCQFIEKQLLGRYLGFRNEIENAPMDSIISEMSNSIVELSENALSIIDFNASSRIYSEVVNE